MFDIASVLVLVCVVILLAVAALWALWMLNRPGDEDEESKTDAASAPQLEAAGAPAPEAVVRPAPAPQTLVMGIDFGTSATKIVVRALESAALPSEYVCAVDFGRLSEMNPSCLLQTALWTDGERVELERRENFRRIADLKIRLMQGESGDAALAETVAYLAAVIRRAREWFAEHNKEWLEDAEEMWRYNIGIPAGIEHEKPQPMCDNYHLVGAAAVALAESPVPINIGAARRGIQAAHSSARAGHVAFVPEVVAQAVGYAQGQGAIDGLGVVVDVGAWTLDACAFILSEASRGDQARFHVQAAKVDNLGCIPLHRRREAATGRSVDFDASRPLPGPTAYGGNGGGMAVIHGVDAEFARECALAVRWVLGEAKRVAGRERVFFGEARIPFIVCGGGRDAAPFKNVSREAWAGFVRDGGAHNGKETQAIHLPMRKPWGLDAEGIDDDNYHRLSVAWGLSHADIQYTLPSGTVVEVHPDLLRPTFDDRGKARP